MSGFKLMKKRVLRRVVCVDCKAIILACNACGTPHNPPRCHRCHIEADKAGKLVTITTYELNGEIVDRETFIKGKK
jgi:hypothetical protein